MAILTCCICERRFDSTKSSALPFCSVRCQQIDLGRWFKEEYGLPVERPEDPDHVDMEPDSD
jgi:uncharacterized protein